MVSEVGLLRVPSRNRQRKEQQVGVEGGVTQLQSWEVGVFCFPGTEVAMQTLAMQKSVITVGCVALEVCLIFRVIFLAM